MAASLPADFDARNHLPGRAIIPIHPQLADKSASRASARLAASSFRAVSVKAEEDFELPDLDDIQGDVIYLFPKKAENFIFFRIANVLSFRKALAQFKPSTSKDAASFILELADRKRRAAPGTKLPIIPKSNSQIAFSRIGLNTLGVRGATGDVRFDNRAMRDDKPVLGDQRDWDPVFEKTKFDPVNGSINDDRNAIHGVFTIAGSDAKTCADASNAAINLFGSSITVMKTMEGRARPGDQAGHEHFGYEDGVSQPALRNLTIARPGQIQVDPGVIILGYKGDPVVDDPDATASRPIWAKGGTLMVFRKLEQSVPEFDSYLKKNGPKWREFAPPGCPQLTNDEGAELWGARMIGRWKSGAPLAKCPFKDDPVLAKDPNRNNDFDYRVRGVSGVSPKTLSDYYCPFVAHTRKTAPRDLDPYIQRRYLESGMIVRAGLPYGIEVTAEERRLGTSSNDEDKKRGLLFVCYQSSLDEGFIRQSIDYAQNNYFPATSIVPQHHGVDPIIAGPPPEGTVGQVNEVKYTPRPGDPPPLKPKTGDQVNLVVDFNGDQVSIAGFASVLPASAKDPPGVPQEFFVTSRGGEYFFVPPLSALRDWAAGKVDSGNALDLLLVLDATSSMQPYIDEVRKRLDDIIDGVVSSGKYQPRDIRVGLIAFRDHPQPDRKGVQQDYEFITKNFGFDADTAITKSKLANLQASGGGDGPEAQCDALTDVASAAWRSDAAKIAIMVTDSPPHGIDEYGDKFADGCPLQNDPIRAANLMARASVTLHVIACEPTLSGSYETAHDFYAGITQITSGKMIALSDSASLCNLIVGSVAESVDIRGLAAQYRADITAQARSGASTAAIGETLRGRLRAADVHAHAIDVEDIYEPDVDGEYNTNVWANATQIDSATKAQLRTVRNFRIKQEYRQGGERYQKAQSAKLVVQPVSSVQVDAIVAAGLRSE